MGFNIDKIDINLNVYSDTPEGKDPDSFSPTLRKYHMRQINFNKVVVEFAMSAKSWRWKVRDNKSNYEGVLLDFRVLRAFRPVWVQPASDR